MNDARTLAHELGGYWRGSYGVARCPAHDDREPSLSVRDGDDGVLVTCHAGCDRHDVIAALVDRDLWATSHRDGTRHRPRDIAPTWPGPSVPDQRAVDLWRSAQKAQGTHAAAYLRARGIALMAPPSLRFVPDAYHAPSGRSLPCMLAAVQSSERAVVAVHRTFLDPDRAAKADITPDRMWLGSFGDGAVRLAQAETELAIAESIEDALSVMELGGPPCWSACSATRMASVALPACVHHVHVCRDRDSAGANGAQKAAERFTAEGRRVTVHAPPQPHGDFNDVLMADDGREVA